MDLTRREFLGFTAAGAVGMTALPQQPLAAAQPRSEGGAFQKWWTMYSDPDGYDCESMRGYWSELSPRQWWASEGDPNPFARLSLVIAPYVGTLLPYFSDCLGLALQNGATVVVESGTGFDHGTFWRHRRWLRESVGIRVGPPRDPWANCSPPGARYVEFTWPRRVTIRDFGRVVPISDQQPGEIIAWAGNLAVAVRHRVGNGTLVYLGSPVGPALWAGDADARRWLHAVVHAA